jgi:hypothetical protein
MRCSWPVVTPTEYIRGRVEIGVVYSYLSAISAVAYTTALYVMVDEGKGGGRAPLPHQPGLFFHHDGMYARDAVVATVVTPQLY